MLREVANEQIRIIKEEADKKVAFTKGLVEKYGHFDFKDYVISSINTGVEVHVLEEERNKAIGHFRKYFEKQGDVRVCSPYGSRCIIIYSLADDFEVWWTTDKPEKYLPKGCSIKEEHYTSLRVVCEA